MESSEFQEVAWQGWKVKIPSSWYPEMEKGGVDKGFMRFEDPAMPRMALHWEKWEKKRRPSISEVLNHYLESWQESAEKGKSSLRGSGRLLKFFRRGKGEADRLSMKLEKTASMRIANHRARYFERGGDLSGVGYLWFCGRRSSFFIVELLGKPEEKKHLRRVAKAIRHTFSCHSRKGQFTEWDILGFSFQTPPEFQLQKRKMLIGTSSFLFRHEKNSKVAIHIYRQTSLKAFTDEELEEWYREELNKQLKEDFGKPKNGEVEPCVINRHDGLKVDASFKESRTSVTRYSMTTYLWVCDEMKKIFAVSFVKPKKEKGFEKQFEKTLKRVKCY